MFLRPEQRKAFRNEPASLYPENNPPGLPIDFRKAVALVDGNFVVELHNLPIGITGVQIDPDQLIEFLKPSPTVRGYVLGQFPDDASIVLVNPPAGVQISPDKNATPEEGKFFFVITANASVPSTTPLSFRIFNKQNAQTFGYSVSYTIPTPTLTVPSPDLEGKEGGPDVAITLFGKNLIAGVTELVPDEASGVAVAPNSVGLEKLPDGTFKLTATLQMAKAKPGPSSLTVRNKRVSSNAVPFLVKKKD